MTALEDLGIEGLDHVEPLGPEGNQIYRARRAEDGQAVVVKMLDPFHEPLVPRRFDLRRKSLNRFVERPGVVPVIELGTTAQGTQYLLMPHYELGSLADRMSDGPMAWPEANGYVKATAETVAAAHELGLVLGDLKPSSIMLDAGPTPTIAVYGMATRRFDNGRPSYAAPESRPGSSDTPAADVYSLCLTLAALVLGREPNRGRPAPEYLTALAAAVPGWLYRTIVRGLAENPTDRFPDARQLAVALRAEEHGVAPAPPDLTVESESTPDDREPSDLVLHGSDPLPGEPDLSDPTDVDALLELPTPPPPRDVGDREPIDLDELLGLVGPLDGGEPTGRHEIVLPQQPPRPPDPAEDAGGSEAPSRTAAGEASDGRPVFDVGDEDEPISVDPESTLILDLTRTGQESTDPGGQPVVDLTLLSPPPTPGIPDAPGPPTPPDQAPTAPTTDTPPTPPDHAPTAPTTDTPPTPPSPTAEPSVAAGASLPPPSTVPPSTPGLPDDEVTIVLDGPVAHQFHAAAHQPPPEPPPTTEAVLVEEPRPNDPTAVFGTGMTLGPSGRRPDQPPRSIWDDAPGAGTALPEDATREVPVTELDDADPFDPARYASPPNRNLPAPVVHSGGGFSDEQLFAGYEPRGHASAHDLLDARRAPLLNDEAVPFRGVQRREATYSSGNIFSRMFGRWASMWLNRRRGFAGALAVLSFAAIAGVVGMLVVQDFRSEPTSTTTPPPAAPTSVAPLPVERGDGAAPVPTSVAPVLPEPPSTHVTAAGRGTVRRLTTTVATTLPPSTTTTTTAPTTATTTASSTTATTTVTIATTVTTVRLPSTISTGVPTTTEDPPEEGAAVVPLPPEGPTEPGLVQGLAVDVGSTTARITFSSPTCVTAVVAVEAADGPTTRIATGANCSRRHSVLLGTVTPPLRPGTDHRVVVTVAGPEGEERHVLDIATTS